MKTIKPAPNQLFCKPHEAEEKTASGFILAPAAAEKPKTALVINIGDEVKGFESKQTIVYKSYSTSDIKLDGVDYFLISEEDVLGVVVEVDG